MPHLARKIIRSVWEPKPYVPEDDARADAGTGCLRTSDDTLSLWQCNATEVSEVVLALASSMRSVEGMHLVLLLEENLNADGIASEPTPDDAKTPIEDLRSRHFNLVNLTMTQICLLAKRIANKVRENSTDLYWFTSKNVLNFLCNAVVDGRLGLNKLEENVRKEVEKELKKRKHLF